MSVIGVVAQSSMLYGPASMVHAIGEAGMASGHQVTIGHVPGYDDTGAEVVRRLIDEDVVGLIVVAPVDGAAALIEAVPDGLPVVTVDGQPHGRTPNVSVDQYTGGLLATRHLLANGHRTVWHVAGPEQWHGSRAREAGWRDALAGAGAPVPPVVRAAWSAESGFRCGLSLAGDPECTAVFAANDDIAIGLLRAMAERGRRVPEDVSVVGFDDVPEAGYTCPGLTTVRQEFAEVGRESVRLLVGRHGQGRHGQGRRPARSVQVPPALVPRGTVAELSRSRA
jgi:DNA-binding LacI/PurR family transcriptional regulator